MLQLTTSGASLTDGSFRGAATEATNEGVPALAISGASGSQISFTTLSTSSSSTTAANLYGALTVSLVNTLVSTARPFLPQGILLNVNFPAIVAGSCDTPQAFKFVLTRINNAGTGTPADVQTCGVDRLPTEESVVRGGGCFSSISVMNATTKGDADADMQGVVLGKLGSILSCR